MKQVTLTPRDLKRLLRDRSIEKHGVAIVIGRHYHHDGPYSGNRKPDLRARQRRLWCELCQGYYFVRSRRR